MLDGWRLVGAITTVMLAGCTARTETLVTPISPTPTGAPTESLSIDGLKIDQPRWKADEASWKLTLSWQAPVGLAVDHYEVVRDGVTLDDAIGSTSFRDTDVVPGGRYRYSVMAVDADGEVTSPAVASIRAGEPPLAEARLEGSFVVRMTVTRASGTKKPVRGGAIFFSFDPQCGRGACSVRWTVRDSRAQGTLRRDGAGYAATLRTPFFVRNCKGRLTDEKLDVALRVRAAAPLRRAWRATKIEGSIDEVSSHRGCLTASIDWDVHGALQS